MNRESVYMYTYPGLSSSPLARALWHGGGTVKAH